MFIRGLHYIALFVLLFLQPLAPVLLRAQVDRTAITGTVTDQQGNRVPQSRVRATESATGFQRETLTTSQGTYELPGLPPGVYSVQFFKAGFAAFTAESVEQTGRANQDAERPAGIGAAVRADHRDGISGATRQGGRDHRRRDRARAGRRFADQRQELGDA